MIRPGSIRAKTPLVNSRQQLALCCAVGVALIAGLAFAAQPALGGTADSAVGAHSTLPQSISPGTAWRLPGAIMQLEPAGSISTSSYYGNYYSSADTVGYYSDEPGTLSIVTHDYNAEALSVDKVDLDTRAKIVSTKTISIEHWQLWGGFYAGPDDHLYILLGRENPDEDDDRSVVAVRRYDHDWNLIGTAYIRGGASQGIKGIYRPFRASAAQMVLEGDRLVVHMGRLMYASGGVHHQANITFEVDVDTMSATTFSELGQYSYSSHSFRQLVTMNDGDLVMIDHGDAYPRAIQMGVMADYPAERKVKEYELFEFNGPIGNNFTGTSVNSIASGPSGVVILGTSIPHPNAPHGTLDTSSIRNVYALWADPANGSHSFKWLTSFSVSDSDRVDEPRVVKVGTDRFAVLFTVRTIRRDGYLVVTEGYRMEYRLINSAGTVLKAETFENASFTPGSEPILHDGTIYWAGIEPKTYDFSSGYLFGMDVSDPWSPSLLSPAGPDARRLSGATRYDTAIAISQHAYPGKAPAVVLATGTQYPDALCAAPLAHAVGGPILLLPKIGMTNPVGDEIKRLDPDQIYIVGGTGVVPASVEAWLSSLADPPDVTRLAGVNRYETSAEVAREVEAELGSCSKIVVATGKNFPDALAAAPIAAAKGWPIILVGNAIPAGVSTAIADLDPKTSLVAGGPSVVSDSVMAQLPSPTRAGGSDRYGTCALLNDYGVTNGLSYASVGLATGASFPDALTMGPAVAADNGLLLLTAPSGPSSAISKRVTANADDIDYLHVAGGTGAVPDDCVVEFLDMCW